MHIAATCLWPGHLYLLEGFDRVLKLCMTGHPSVATGPQRIWFGHCQSHAELQPTNGHHWWGKCAESTSHKIVQSHSCGIRQRWLPIMFQLVTFIFASHTPFCQLHVQLYPARLGRHDHCPNSRCIRQGRVAELHLSVASILSDWVPCLAATSLQFMNGSV